MRGVELPPGIYTRPVSKCPKVALAFNRTTTQESHCVLRSLARVTHDERGPKVYSIERIGDSVPQALRAQSGL